MYVYIYFFFQEKSVHCFVLFSCSKSTEYYSLLYPIDWSLVRRLDSMGQWGLPRLQRKSTLNNHWKDGCWSSNIWCKEPTHWKSPCCWERLRAGGEGGNRGWDGWMASWLNGHELKQTQGDSEDRETWCAAVHGVAKSWTRPSDWTRTDCKEPIFMGKEMEGKLLT